MTSLAELQTRFGIPGVVGIGPGQGGLLRLVIVTDDAEAQVYLHGAHVTHYQPKGQAPLLWMSGKSWFDPAKPIRGGVPICFPWFGPRAGDPKSPAHGFARLRDWSLESTKRNADGSVTVVLSLSSDDATRAMWPHDFVLRHIITVGKTLQMALELRNTSGEPLTFEEALHTYLTVGDVRKVSVTGLAGVSYLDKVGPAQRKAQGNEPITITAETDRVYLNTQSTCVVDDPAGGRRISIAKEGSNATVVWNPWIAKAKAMPDYGDDEWPGMICIETCNVAENAVTVPAGQSHVMRAIVTSRKS